MLDLACTSESIGEGGLKGWEKSEKWEGDGGKWRIANSAVQSAKFATTIDTVC